MSSVDFGVPDFCFSISESQHLRQFTLHHAPRFADIAPNGDLSLTWYDPQLESDGRNGWRKVPPL
jgi:hypothetical protein